MHDGDEQTPLWFCRCTIVDAAWRKRHVIKALDFWYSCTFVITWATMRTVYQQLWCDWVDGLHRKAPFGIKEQTCFLQVDFPRRLLFPLCSPHGMQSWYLDESLVDRFHHMRKIQLHRLKMSAARLAFLIAFAAPSLCPPTKQEEGSEDESHWDC